MRKVLVGTLLIIFLQPAIALDLLQSFRQALINNPTYLNIQVKNKALVQQYAIDRANLLPQLALSASAATTRSQGQSSTSNSYLLSLTQNLFNYSGWITVKSDLYNNKSYGYTNAAALQDLAVTVAKAYWQVVLYQQDVTLDQQQLADDRYLIKQAKNQFYAGKTTRIDVTSTQSTYAADKTTFYSDQSQLAAARATLMENTGINVTQVKSLMKKIPLIYPKPASLTAWISKTKRHNFTILADHFAVLAAQQAIKVVRGARFPTLGASASYGNQFDSATNTGFSPGNTASLTAGLNLNWRLFQGGGISAKTKQAQYQFETAITQEKMDIAKYIAQTQTNYQTIVNNVAAITALHNAVNLASKNYQSYLDGYHSGIVKVATMNNVIQAKKELYTERKDLLTTQISYINALFLLKQAAGLLSPTDFITINRWLK